MNNLLTSLKQNRKQQNKFIRLLKGCRALFFLLWFGLKEKLYKFLKGFFKKLLGFLYLCLTFGHIRIFWGNCLQGKGTYMLFKFEVNLINTLLS